MSKNPNIPKPTVIWGMHLKWNKEICRMGKGQKPVPIGTLSLGDFDGQNGVCPSYCYKLRTHPNGVYGFRLPL